MKATLNGGSLRSGKWAALTAWAVAWSAMAPSIAFGYGIGNGAGGKMAHQWITQEGYKLFKSQFGVSEIDGFIGTVGEFPGGANNRVIEGAYDEDVGGENPWGETSALEHPSLRHFWDHYGDFHRDFDDGLLSYNSSANRSVQYFTGGAGLTGTADSDWGPTQGAVAGRGITGEYALGKGKAYYWLGHVAHLLQDATVPAHVHNDSHLETGYNTPFEDPDPLHDWVDGVQFAVAGNGVDGRPAAAFNDTNPTRYQKWLFRADLNALARTDSVVPILNGDLRRPNQFGTNVLALPEGAASVPGGTTASVLPLYHLFLDTASISDNFDSRDFNGQVDQKSRRNDDLIDILDRYDEWSFGELEQVANTVVPRAMFATAELIRYFYSQVDPTPPVVSIASFSGDPNAPEVFRVPASGISSISGLATAVDATSGIDLDRFLTTIDKYNGTNFVPFLSVLPSTGGFTFSNLGLGIYRVYSRVENGGGLEGTSSFRYFNVALIPEPGSLTLLALGAVVLGRRRMRPGFSARQRELLPPKCELSIRNR